MTTTGTARPSARERLLDAAAELFYAEGIQSVGIDRIIERAGVAKASLYNCFRSKDDLVAAYLAARHDRTTARIRAAIERAGTPREQILAVFESQAGAIQGPGYNGCAFAAATTEAAHGVVVDEVTERYRGWFRALFTDLAAAAGAADPGGLGRQLHLVYEGAAQTGRLDADKAAVVATARAVVETLLDAHLGTLG